jgi:hypothetical protein
LTRLDVKDLHGRRGRGKVDSHGPRGRSEPPGEPQRGMTWRLPDPPHVQSRTSAALTFQTTSTRPGLDCDLGLGPESPRKPHRERPGPLPTVSDRSDVSRRPRVTERDKAKVRHRKGSQPAARGARSKAPVNYRSLRERTPARLSVKPISAGFSFYPMVPKSPPSR